MIKIFDAHDKNFISNGNFVIDAYKCIETKKKSLNGWFIDVETSIKYSDDLKQDMLCVIKTKSKLNPQAFRIKNVKKTSTKISFQAEHVMFDARDYFLVDVRPTNMGAVGALNYVNTRVDKLSPFTVTSDVNNTSTAYFINRNLLEAWTVIEERWGGSFDADNFDISLSKKIGSDKGETLVYGADLERVEVLEDWSNVVTRIYPVGPDGITPPQKFFDANISYPTNYTKKVSFESEIEDEEIDDEVLIAELIENAEAYLNINKYPKVSYLIKSDVKQNLEIGDIIKVMHPLVEIETEVQEYTYNINTERVLTLEFGNYSRDVKKRFDAIKEEIQNAKDSASKAEYLTAKQTEMINNLNKLGLVYIDDNEILILDKLPKEQAKNVWRWGMGGLGFSNNGYEGPFEYAFTQNGFFNANFIMAGSITTNHLSSEVGSSLDLSSNESLNLIVDSVRNESNLILSLNGSEDLPYQNWVFEQSGLIPSTDLYPGDEIYPENVDSPIFQFIVVKDSLSKYGLQFDAKGRSYTSAAYVVPDAPHSYRGKRISGNQRFRIYIREYTKLGSNYNENFTEKLLLDASSSNLYEAATTELKSSTMEVRLVFETLDSNELVLTEQMFNRRGPKEYADSPTDVKFYAESQIKLLNDEIKLSSEAVDLLNKDIHNAGVEINARDGITTYGKKFEVMDENRTKTYMRVTDSGLFVDGNIEAGSVGDLELKDGFLYKTTKTLTKFYQTSDLDRLRDILMQNIQPTPQDWVDLDINGDGKMDIGDMVLIRKIIESGDKFNPATKIKGIKFGGNSGELETWFEIEGITAGNFSTRLDGQVIETVNLRAYTISNPRNLNTKISINDEGISLLAGTGNIITDSGYSDDTGNYNAISIVKDNGLVHIAGRSGIRLDSGNNSNLEYSGRGIMPSISNFSSLGNSSKRFSNIYLNNQPNVSSDVRYKFEIQEIDSQLVRIIAEEVKPKQYRTKFDDKIHFGYVAQDVERALYKYHLTKHGHKFADELIREFAMLSKSESYMSLLYGEISVIIDAYNRQKMTNLENRLLALEGEKNNE